MEAELEALLADAATARPSARPAPPVGVGWAVDPGPRRRRRVPGPPGGQSLERPAASTGSRVVLDCANGAACALAPAVFEALGAEVVTIGVRTPTAPTSTTACGSTHPGALA